MKKISLLFFLLSFSTFFSTFLYAWDWPQCRNTNGGDPEQPSTVYLGDKSLTFGHDSWATVNDKGPKWRMWISTDASLTSGTGSQSSEWSGYSNVEHKTSSSPQFTSTGTWYWGVQVEYTDAGGTTGWYCRNDKNWNGMWGTPTSTLTITVNPLNTPSAQTAAFTASTTVHLTWSKDAQGHNVMIVRYAKGATPTTPTNGTGYSVGSTLGSGDNQGTVVYNSSGTSYDDTGVTSGNNYDYYFYSENNSYYSSGMKATADYPTTPTTAASNLSFSSVKPSKMTLSWTSGNGANRIVVAKADSAPTGTPSDGSSYTANAAYGTSGTALGDGYVVYNGSSNTVTVTALTASTTYYFAIYEYNGTGTATKYLTSSYLSGNQATAAPYQITLKFKMPTENWTTANGVYLYAWDSDHPKGFVTWPGVAMESIGSNWYTKTFTFTNETVDIIFNDNNSGHQTVDITGVNSSTCYEGDTWTGNGGKWTVKSVTCPGETATPTTAASNLSFSDVTATQMKLSWTNGNGANRIVVAKAGSAPSTDPSDGSSYTYNATYGTSGTALGDGYVVYNGSSNTVTVTGLSPSTTYYFKIYEYNGTGTATKYLTSSCLSGSQSTTTTSAIEITVKFKMPTTNWTTANGVYLYAWNGGTLDPSGLGIWPGVAMDAIGDDWYSKTFTFTGSTVSIIFNDKNSGHQTIDITGVNSSTCYEYDTWTGGKWTTKIAASCPGEYYYRSKGTGNWGATGSWQQSSDGTNWTDATVIPSSGALGITIQPDHTISVSSAVYSSNCTVNGTLEIQNGGSLSHAPTFGSGSTLKYNTGTSSVPGAEWKPNVTSGAGYPYNIQIASGTLQMSVASFANKYYAAGNVTVANGAKLDFNMAYDSNVAEHQGKAVVIVNGDITNNGTIYFANSKGGGNLAFQCKTMTNAGTLSLSENTSAPLQAIGGDMILTGDFINNGTFNCNGRAIVFTGSANQKIDGNTDGTYAIDFMVLDKTGGQVTLYKDVTCKGYSASGGGYWALSLSGGTLVLNGKTLEISATDSDLATNKGRAGVQCVNGGKIKGDKDATVRLLGKYTRWTASSGQSLIFDQTTKGVTNVLKDLTINRIDSAGLSDKITINNIIIDHLLDIQAGKVEVSNHLGLDTAAVGRLSSTYTTASLKVKKLILGKSPLHAAEFYRNGRTLTIDDKVMVKVHFYHTAQWNFFAFPFPITQILKADTTTTATWNTDYSVGIYDPVRRANRTSGWKTLTNVTTLKADTGYIINKKGSVADLFFVTNAKSDDESFGNPSSSSPVNTAVSYTTVSGGLTCNFGWNFVSQPLVAKATSSLSNGQFAYSYNPANDAYKLYYGSDNPGYTYGGSASLVPYEAFFVKTAAAGNMGSYITSPQGVRRRADAQLEDVVQLNLSANGNNYETLVRMLPQATAGYDELYDAPYSEPMNATTPRIYTLSSGSNYALALNTVPEETTVPVYVKVPQAGDYSFNWNTQLTNLPVTLTDRQTGETVDLSTETEYAFQTSTTEIKDRFYLNVPKRVITGNVNIENTDHFLKIHPQGSSIEIEGLKGASQIYVADMAGHILQAKTTSDSHCKLEVPVAGIYMLFIRDAQHSGFRTKIMVW